MKNYICKFVVLLACVFSADACDGKTAEQFFAPAPDAGKALDAAKLYPQGRILTFSLYSVDSPQIEKSQADGFTCIGPYYGDQKDVVQKARANGVKCFYTVGKRINFVKDPNYVMPADAQLISEITSQVKEVAANQEIAFWNLACEELRNWKPDEMRWLEVAAGAVRAADPCGRPVMMYEPCHRNAAALAKTLKYQDICAKGSYVNALDDKKGTTFKDQRVWIRWSIDQELAAIGAVNPSATPFVVLWMAKDPQDSNEIRLIRSWCRHDVYLGLVSGAKGVLIWSGYNKRKGFEKTFDDYYEGYASAARELNGQAQLSQVFLFGQRRSDIKVRVVSGPDTLQVKYDKQIHTYPSVNYLDAAYGQSRYLIMVNSANVPVHVIVSGLPGEAVNRRDLFKQTAGDTVSGEFEVSLEPLEVKGFCFEKNGQTKQS